MKPYFYKNNWIQKFEIWSQYLLLETCKSPLHFLKPPLPFPLFITLFTNPISTTPPSQLSLSLSISLGFCNAATYFSQEINKMASKKVLSLILLCTISVSCCIWAEGASHRHASAPAPSVDCTTLVLSMADCLSFVSNDSTSKKPEGTCCSGLKTVLGTDAECLCEAFKSSAQFGVVLNVTKALALPSACKIKAPPASNCGCKYFALYFCFSLNISCGVSRICCFSSLFG